MDPEEGKDKPNNFVGMHGENVGLGFTARDTAVKLQEQTNQIQFKVIRNDQSNESSKFLLDLKNIFARQLPKMPKEYIVKLVFDRNHQSMIILKNNTKVFGGICFREFKNQRFAEIAFLAINSSEQIQGFGTRLMNKLKEEMQRRKVEYLMTYADNLALGYFRKQGFSKDCRMPAERWKGYIKDYEGGTMMECFVHPTIDYSKISEIIKRQKEFVMKKIKELSINGVKYDSRAFENRVPSEGYVHRNKDGEEEHFRINPLEIPGIKESGWSWADHDEFVKSKDMSFSLECQSVLDMLKKHQASWPFRDPVSIEDVPDYNLIVKDPIDLKTIEKKLSSNEYRTREQFCEDITKIFRNCRHYNQPETVYYKCSIELQEYIRSHLESLKDGRSDLFAGDSRKTAIKINKKKTISKPAKKKD